MSRPHNEDLFEDTKMTFGEHLEELRTALIKSLMALVVGFLIGLLFGNYVVRFLQTPIQNALENYYQDQAIVEVQQLMSDRAERGEPLPSGLADLGDLDESGRKAAIKEFLQTERLLPEEVYLDVEGLVGELQLRYPEAIDKDWRPAESDAGETKKPGSMMRIFLWRPLEKDPRLKVRSLSAQEPFFIYIKAALVSGAILSGPFIFWYIWTFVAAGLYPHERSYVWKFMPLSIGLFLAGAALAFFAVFGFVLDFLFSFNAWMGIDPDPRISEWLSFVLILPLGFGVAFQLPLVMLFLERIGIFSVQTYLSKWRIAVLVIAVISMLLTPADPMSMLLMAGPLTVLYFGGIVLCRWMPKGRSPFADPIE
jgi:sec-independent protein translocase protein TatC